MLKIKFDNFIHGAVKPVLVVIISVLIIAGIAKAGSLTPAAAPASTMQDLTTIYNKNTSTYATCYSLINGSATYTCYTGFTNVQDVSIGQIGYNGGSMYSHQCCMAR